MSVCDVQSVVPGESHPVDSDQYLGIESLWNHRNYWINMQDCAQGLKVIHLLHVMTFSINLLTTIAEHDL